MVRSRLLGCLDVFRQQSYSVYFAFLVTLAVVLLSFFLVFTYRQTEKSIKNNSTNESRILASQMDATLRRIKANSDLVAENIILEALSDPISPVQVDRINQKLNVLTRFFPEIIGHHFFDSEGQLIFSSDSIKEKISISDRPHFKHIKEFPNVEMHFTETLIAKTTKNPTVFVYRAVVGSGGKFLGVISTPINLHFFEQLFARLHVGAQGMVSIRRSDDSRLVVRWPDVQQGINKEALDIPPYQQIQRGILEGVVRYIGRTDGVDRIFAFNKISDFPFFVLVGYSFDEQFAKWYKIAGITSAFTFMALLLLGMFLYRLKRSQANLLKSERRYQAIVESQHDAVCRWLPDTTITFANSQYAKLFVSAENQNLIGQRWIGFIPENERNATMNTYFHLLEQPQPFSCERSVTFQNGEIRLFHWVDIPLLDASGKCIEFQSVGRDISELKQAEKEQQRLQTLLIQAQKMEAIGTLAGGIAHDFNNILGAVIGYAEMARDASASKSAVAHDLDKVLEASHRAAALVKQILDFSRQSDTKRILLDPSSIIKEAVKLLRPILPSTITIRQDIRTATKSIFADPTQIHQVVMNLCTNAFHAMEQAGGILDISLTDCELSLEDLQSFPEVKPGKFVVISIGDSGPGIPPNILSKIFDPYFTTKEIGKGTGMGLAIVHGIVTNSGGSISCKSESGKGTVFHVIFPAIERGNPTSTEEDEHIPTGKERILLIDDEHMLVEMGQSMLERLGYKVTVRTSSLEALTLFQNQPDQFDVIITDQTMPGMTGVDLARRMLHVRPSVSIILCTGYSNLVDEELARSYGIKGFIMKPMTKKDISKLLRNVLGDKVQA